MMRTVLYAAWQFAEGIGIIAGELLVRIWPPEPFPPPLDDWWTDGT